MKKIWATKKFLVSVLLLVLIAVLIYFLNSSINKAATLIPIAQNTISLPEESKSCSLESNRIVDMSFEKSGDLWVASRHSIAHWNLQANEYSSYNLGDETDLNMRSILSDANQNIWVGTDNGLWRFDGTIWIDYSPGGSFGSLVESSGNHVWAVGGPQFDSNLYWYDTKIWTKYKFVKDAEWITSFVVQSNGTVWANFNIPAREHDGIGLGVWRFNDTKWEEVPELPGNRNSRYVLTQDSQGILWFVESNNPFVGYKGSIHKFDGENWETYPIDIETMISVATDSKNIVWIASRKGLYSFDGAKLSAHILPSIDSSITSIAISLDNTVCLGTDRNGVWCKQSDKWLNYKSDCP